MTFMAFTPKSTIMLNNVLKRIMLNKIENRKEDDDDDVAITVVVITIVQLHILSIYY